MIPEITAYCGLDCGFCPVFIATQNNDDELRQETAEEWSALYSEHIGKSRLKTEDMNCQGCRTGGELLFIGCTNCPIRKCSSGKNYVSCAECGDFGSCKMLNGFFTAVPQAKENLMLLRKKG